MAIPLILLTVSIQTFEEVIANTPGIGAVCFNALKSFGYTFEEAEQEGLYRLFTYMADGYTVDYPKSWLKTVLYNQAVDEVESKQHRITDNADVNELYLTCEDSFDMPSVHFIAGLKELTGSQITYIFMNKYLGYEVKEIADE